MAKKLLLTVLSFLLFALNPLIAQLVFKTTPTSVISYLEYVPSDYNSNSNKYPVVFFLHGIGERGPNSTDPAVLQAGVWTIAKHGPPKHVKNGTQFPFILVAIQLKNIYGTWPTWYVMEVINHVKTYLRIDERRIHITGLSLGGGGTWTMAQDYPKLFATVAPVCGGYNTPSKACNIAAENLPVWAFHGDADDIVGLSKSSTMVNAINACSPTPNPQAKLSIYPGVKHNAWDRAYYPDNTYHNPNVYQWLMSYTNTANGGNKIPVANAGSDRTSGSTSLTLSGSGSDTDGSIVSYAWTKIAGPSATLTNTTTSTLGLSGLVAGTYMFRLMVTDNSGNTDSDYVKLTVQLAPTANAGADATITLPTTSKTLTGTGSDLDGTIASYNWTFISGPSTPTLTNANTPTVTASNLSVAGDYVLQLEVKDNSNASGKDQVIIRVLNSTSSNVTVNQLPVVNAGKDQKFYLPTTSTVLTGTASDPDGSITKYAWVQVSGPVATTLSGASTDKLTVSNMTAAGFYVYKLTVTDDKGATAYDRVGVTVYSPMTTTASLMENIRLTEGEEEAEPSWADFSHKYWLDKNVVLYNEEGREIYKGAWNESAYVRVTENSRFFVFNIIKNGTRIKSGKYLIVR